MDIQPIGKVILLTLFMVPLILFCNAADALSQEDVTRAAEMTVGYLMKSQKDDGLFEYEFDFLKNKYSSDDNIVRQAGAGAVLAEYYRATGDQRVEPVLIAAIQGYASRSIEIRQGKVVSLKRSRRSARSGATALALLTELRYHERSGSNRFQRIRQDWRNGLLALRVPGGGFWEYPGADDELSYFNGEIWLSLAHYHRLFPEDEDVRRTLKEVDEIFMARYGAEEKGGFFLWGLQAAATRYASGAGQVYHRYALDKVRFYLEERRPRFSKNAMHCASMEGLVAVLEILQADDSVNAEHGQLKDKLSRRVEREMEKHLTFQIQHGQEKIHYRDGVHLYSERLPEFAGAFLNGRFDTETRIDFTWHCLSSLVKYGLVINADGYGLPPQ